MKIKKKEVLDVAGKKREIYVKEAEPAKAEKEAENKDDVKKSMNPLDKSTFVSLRDVREESFFDQVAKAGEDVTEVYDTPDIGNTLTNLDNVESADIKKVLKAVQGEDPSEIGKRGAEEVLEAESDIDITQMFDEAISMIEEATTASIPTIKKDNPENYVPTGKVGRPPMSEEEKAEAKEKRDIKNKAEESVKHKEAIANRNKSLAAARAKKAAKRKAKK